MVAILTICAGTFEHGVRSGIGTLTLGPEPATSYEGTWQGGHKHGFGTLTYPTGSFYQGQWQHERRSGLGTMHWQSRQERYRGLWEADVPSNVGEHVWFAGTDPDSCNHASHIRCNRYVGMMAHGERSGEGTMLYSSGERCPIPKRCRPPVATSGPLHVLATLASSCRAKSMPCSKCLAWLAWRGGR